MLRDHKEYHELGPDYFDRLDPQRLQRYLVNRLQSLGYDVALTPTDPSDGAV